MQAFLYTHDIVEYLTGDDSISQWFGKPAQDVIEKFGEPDVKLQMCDIQDNLNSPELACVNDEDYIYIFVED